MILRIALLGCGAVVPLCFANDKKEGENKQTPLPLKIGAHFSKPKIPADNPLSVERASLGEVLFNDKSLSRDHSTSCATCHNGFLFFSDSSPLSRGVDNQAGRRNTQPIFNLAWKESFFWDGRAPSLRAQALDPIQDPTEMDLQLDEMVKRLKSSPQYPQLFADAFGDDEINAGRVGLALENFMLSLTSMDSKYDQFKEGKAELSAIEKRGMELFFTKPGGVKRGAGCFQCHSGENFADNSFHNNGIGHSEADLGRYEFTKKNTDKYKFATPSLRNLESTAPFMHDGRFETIEEVIEHYNNPIEKSATLAPEIAEFADQGLGLSSADKVALIAFLRTLSARERHPLPGSQGEDH